MDILKTWLIEMVWRELGGKRDGKGEADKK